MRKSTEAYTVGGVITTVGGSVMLLSPVLGVLVIVAGLGVILHAVRTAKRERSGEPDQWISDIESFERVALDFWTRIGAAFADSDIHPLPPNQGDPLNATVRHSCWPDDQPECSDPNRSLATAWTREMSRRIYGLGGKDLFGTTLELLEFDKARHVLAQLLRRWRPKLNSNVGFARAVGQHLGPLHLRTVKLLWYVEQAKAESIGNTKPDYRFVAALRDALQAVVEDDELAPDRIGTPHPNNKAAPTVQLHPFRMPTGLIGFQVRNIRAGERAFHAQISTSLGTFDGYWGRAGGRKTVLFEGERDALWIARPNRGPLPEARIPPPGHLSALWLTYWDVGTRQCEAVPALSEIAGEGRARRHLKVTVFGDLPEGPHKSQWILTFDGLEPCSDERAKELES